MRQFLLLALLLPAFAYSQVNLTQGLKAHYTFTGNANDASGSGFHGNAQAGVALTTDRFGNANSAYRFDGVDDRIVVTDNGGLSTPAFSICYYFMTESTTYQNCIGKVNYADGNGATYNSGVFPTGMKPYFATIGSSGNCFEWVTSTLSYTIFSPATIQTNRWYCVVNTFENGVEKLYIDGMLVSQGTTPFNNGTFCTNTNFVIGSWWQGDPYRFKGKMDDVRFYNRAINVNEVNALCGTTPAAPCDSWLNTLTAGSSVKVGDLDVSGNQITVEAQINRTAPYVGSYMYAGDIVSKHTDPSDANYLLRPNNAEITTSNGYFKTPSICDIQLNKTYHVALVYNGSSLKFYRNGFLMSQVAASGNLVQNNLVTTIGDWANYVTGVGTNFIGRTNEVRIWNVARSQAQLQTYMNASLPTPNTQTGLLAYYTFDNLLNEQGNATWTGVLTGTAAVNTTNPNCTYTADSCVITLIGTGIRDIINDYTPVIGLSPCDNKLTVEDAAKYNTGDTVLLIQMKGAVIDSANTAGFGLVTDYKNAGNYEVNYVRSKSGNVLELKNKITRSYDIPLGKVQLVRVPYYNNATVTNTLTCLPWDGSKGGILVLNVKDTINLQGDIDVSGLGFKGGAGYNSNSSSLTCALNDYYYPSTHQFSGRKGESITTISDNIIRGKGRLAAGGGGGLGHNSGGGGGANGGDGGMGGYQLDNCGGAPFDNRGFGGQQLLNNSSTNKIFMGSGGGAGQADNVGNIPPAGGDGGGLVIIMSNFLKSNGRNVDANGEDATACIQSGSSDCHDGMGGGGAGGTVLLAVNNFIDAANINKNGGKGGNVSSTVAAAGKIGPGGGGGGGVLYLNKPSLPPTVTSLNAGGANGVLALAGNTAWGATSGNPGLNIFNLTLPIDNILFKRNIDSVRIKDSATSCVGFDFKGLGYINASPITSWEWYFGDGGSATTQNTNHTYLGAGIFTVKLIVTDINGCKDSVIKNVNTSTLSAEAGTDTAFCSNGSVTVQLHGTGSGTISWTPAMYLDNSTIQDPTATVSSTTVFYLNVSNAVGCFGKDSVTVKVSPIPVVKTLNDTSICRGTALILNTVTGPGSYHWSPGIYVNDSTIANPAFIDTLTQTLIVTTTNSSLCSASDTVTVTVKTLPQLTASADTLICSTQPLTLSAAGASTYNWSPAIFLSNPNISNPVFSGNLSTVYYLTGTGINGCTAKDTVRVNVNSPGNLITPTGKSMCLNKSVQLDGANGNTYLYSWSPVSYLSNSTIIDPIASPPSSMNYILTITDEACNVDSIFTVPVNVRALPPVIATSSNDINCTIRQSNLNASGAVQFLWNVSPTLSNTTIANPIASPTINTLYIVTGTDNFGCQNKDSVMVLVSAGMNGYVIPNAFTPNNDGTNDCFGIKHWGSAQELTFIIYSRWGEKVFETNNVNVCWDGKFKGQPAIAGTYVYYITGTTPCGKMVKKGNVLLIR